VKQHIIPKCYLKAWCDPNRPQHYVPCIWLISKDGQTKTPKPPLKSFREPHIYTIKLQSGNEDFSVETTLQQLEGRYVRIIERFISKRSRINPQDRAILIAFIAAMYGRTSNFGDATAAFLSDVHRNVSALERKYKGPNPPPPPPEIGTGTPTSSEETELLQKNARPYSVLAAVELASLLNKLALAIFEAPGNGHFITSDNPCVWFSPSACQLPLMFQQPNLSMPDIEISMPLTPRFCAVLTYNGNREGYYVASSKLMDDLNRRTWASCSETFVSQTEKIAGDGVLRD
jgi:hypothetical protein